MRTVYLDNNATTAVAPEVREAMEGYFTAEYFNPSSAYDRASPAAQAVKRARETVARLLGGVDPSEILFTSCATESLNTALYGAVRANPARRHVDIRRRDGWARSALHIRDLGRPVLQRGLHTLRTHPHQPVPAQTPAGSRA